MRWPWYVEAFKTRGDADDKDADKSAEQIIEEFNHYLRNPKNDPNAPEELKSSQADRQEEALTIYRWWKYEKPKDEKKQREMTISLYGRSCKVAEGEREAYREALWALQQKIHDDEQSMLHRLVDIRPSLWT